MPPWDIGMFKFSLKKLSSVTINGIEITRAIRYKSRLKLMSLNVMVAVYVFLLVQRALQIIDGKARLVDERYCDGWVHVSENVLRVR